MPAEKNKNTFCYFFSEGGKPTEVLAAGQIVEKELKVNLWVWDDGLRKEIEKQIELMGGEDRMLYRTVDRSHELKAEGDMLQYTPTEQELKDQAAKGKGGGKSEYKGNKNSEKGKGGGGKSEYKGNKSSEKDRERRW